MQPFSIRCMTCSASLKVRDRSAIGQILACPKCHSMVMVEAPDDVDTTPADQHETTLAAGAVAAPLVPPPVPEPPTAAETVPPQAAPPPAPPAEPTLAAAAAPPIESTPAEVPPVNTAPPTAAAPVATATQAVPTMPSLPQPIWQKWLFLGTAGTVGVMFSVSLFLFWKSHQTQPAPTPAAVAVAKSPASVLEEPQPNSETTTPAAVAKPAADDAANHSVSTAETAPPSTPPPSSPAPAPVEPTLPEQPAQPAELAENDDDLLDDLLIAEQPGEETNAAPDTDAPDTDDPTKTTDDEPQANERQIPAPHPDIASRLNMRLDGVEFSNTELRRFLTVLSEMTAVPIEANDTLLAQAGISARKTISYEGETATVSEILESVLSRLGLRQIATGDHVVVTLGSDAAVPRRTVRYRVSDLVAGEADADALVQLVRRVIAPASWEPAGGPATLTLIDDMLVVRQTPPVHHELIVLCEKLRAARGLPLRTNPEKFDPTQFDLASRRRQAADALGQDILLGGRGAVTLVDAARWIGFQSNMVVEIDELALLKGGVSPSAPVRLPEEPQPVQKVLEGLLEPLGLTYRVINRNMVEITTPGAVAKTYEIEYYSAGELTGSDDVASQLVERIRRQIAPETWEAAAGPGIHFDAKSRYLIVRQSQPVQRQLEAALDQWRTRGK